MKKQINTHTECKKPEEYKGSFNPELLAFCEDNGIHFYPWVGKDYFSSNKKILILGESYYLDDWNPTGRIDLDITKDASPHAIRKYLGEENCKAQTKEFITLDKATRVILGIERSSVNIAQRCSLWHSVVYSVFIQNSFRKKVADSSPFNKEEIEKDLEILDALLLKFKPDLVISFSIRIQKLIASKPVIKSFEASAKRRKLSYYIWKRNGFKIFGIPHPSILWNRIAIKNLHEAYKSVYYEA